MAKGLNIDAYLGKAKQMVYRVGIELEGGWKKLPAGVQALQRDGSVKGLEDRDNNDPILMEQLDMLRTQIQRARTTATIDRLQREYEGLRRKTGKGLHVGELQSDILEVPRLPLWMKKNYPQVVNDTCGMHIHMSFKGAMNYQRLMIPEYTSTLVDYMIEWAKEEGLKGSHPVWPRLKNESEYCQHKFQADEQANVTTKEYNHSAPGHRYTAVNYPFNRIGTIECRLLPMMETVEQAIRAVHRVLDITNATIVVVAKTFKEDKFIAEVVADQQIGVIREEKVEYV